jgi:predicted amidohydrolase
MVAPAQLGQHPPGNWSYGRSLIVDPWGTILATAPDAETVITADIDLSRMEQVRRQIPSLANRMPEHYRWPEGERVLTTG